MKKLVISTVLLFALVTGACATADITVTVTNPSDISPLLFGQHSTWWHGGSDLAKSPMPALPESIIKTQAKPILQDALTTGLVRFPAAEPGSYHWRRGEPASFIQ